MSDLMSEALGLMAVGMGFVFVFLAVLVVVTTLMSKLVNKFAPVPEPAVPAAAPAVAPSSTDPKILAVLQEAVDKYRSGKR